MASVDIGDIYYNNWKEASKKIDQLEEKMAVLHKKIEPKIKLLRDERKEKNDELANRQEEFRKKAIKYLEEKIRCERKKKKNKIEAFLENDEVLKDMYDELEVLQRECADFCEETDEKIQKLWLPYEKYQKEKKEQQAISEKYMDLWTSTWPKESSSSRDDSSLYSLDLPSYDSSSYLNTSTSNSSQAFEDALKKDREARWEHDREEEKRRQREYDQHQKEEDRRRQREYDQQRKEEDRRRREDERRQQEEARKQAELARKQAEREEYARRMEADRQRRQQEEAARREAHRIRYYHGIVYFKNGTTRRTGSTNVRQNAERMAVDLYNQAMRTATSDYSKPTRYEVVED